MSMDAVETEDREIQRLLRGCEHQLVKIKDEISITRKKQILKKVEQELEQAKRTIKRVEIETRDLSPDERSVVRQALKARAAKLRELKNEVKWMLSDVNADGTQTPKKSTALGLARKSLLRSGSKEPVEEKDTEETLRRERRERLSDDPDWERDGGNADSFMDYGRDIQKQDINILDRVIVNVDQTKQLGTDTAAKVQAQTEQIGQIDSTLGAIDNELVRANRVLRAILRRMLGDKVLWLFIGMVFLGLMVIIADQLFDL